MSFTETMTPRERTMAALNRQPVDRPPVANPTNVATVDLMDLVDAPFPDACRDPELAARLAATGYTELGFDAVAPYFTIIQESSALGCDMQWEDKDNWPTVRMYRPIWKDSRDVHIPSGFLEHPDNITITKSIEILKQEIGDEVAVIGKTMGPWTLAYHVFGVENFLLMTIDDPDETMRCLHKLKELSVLFGEAQIAAGADALTFPDHATGDLVSGEYYRRFLQDIHIEMAERLNVPLILHICGNTLDRMPYIADTGMAYFPLRLQERSASGDGHGGRQDRPGRQHQQPDYTLRTGTGRGSGRGLRLPGRWSADDRARMRDSPGHQAGESHGDTGGRARMVRAQLVKNQSRTPDLRLVRILASGQTNSERVETCR